jgi:membrane protein YdbS with pleckstrin-like domain
MRRGRTTWDAGGLSGHDDRMAADDLDPESHRVKAVWATLFWLASSVFFVGVVVADTELTFPRGSLSESASDVIAVPLALFSAWALSVWIRRLMRAHRA